VKDVPQPQDAIALGFSMLNPVLFKPSEKFRVPPLT
tara:strand:+ start:709 stop:816 length:108 start_codon:yes stop_codon:yes gene_type:complete